MAGEEQPDARGRDADSPTDYAWAAWRQILGRVWIKTGTDNIGLLAAGIAFYAFLSFVPLLGALVMTYGLIADPSTIADHMRTIVRVVPKDAATLILDQIVNLVTTASTKKGVGLALAVLVSIYGATRASGAIIMALNVIYEQVERRSLIRTTMLSFVMIVGAVCVAIAGLLAASALALLNKAAEQFGTAGAVAISLATWTVATGLACIGIAVTYRIAPDRSDAKWRWLSLGSALATILWLIVTLGFGLYVTTLGNYNATYGSLSAVVVLLMWLWVSAYAILLGAEINAEAERQTARDSTTGPERPIGTRGATVADQVAA